MGQLTVMIPKMFDEKGVEDLLAKIESVLSFPTRGSDTEIHFDFTHCSWITPVGMTTITALIQYLQHLGGYTQTLSYPSKQSTHNYLQRMNFYSTLGVTSNYLFAKHPAEGRFCELSKVNNINECNAVISQIVNMIATNISDNHPGERKKYKWAEKVLSSAIGEIINNVFYHSDSPIKGFIQAQYYPNSNEIKAAVVDCGKGIRASLSELSKYKKRIVSDEEAIFLAIQKNISSKPDYHSGHGLYLTNKYIEANKGQLYIFSGKGRVVTNLNTKAYSSSNWPGTIVSITIDANNPVLVEQIFDQEMQLEPTLLSAIDGL